MGCVKQHWEDVILIIAKDTGYSEDFLWDIWLKSLEGEEVTFDANYVKRYMEKNIADLAEETGYSEDYLLDIWSEYMEDGEVSFNAFDEFVAITLERDW